MDANGQAFNAMGCKGSEVRIFSPRPVKSKGCRFRSVTLFHFWRSVSGACPKYRQLALTTIHAGKPVSAISICSIFTALLTPVESSDSDYRQWGSQIHITSHPILHVVNAMDFDSCNASRNPIIIFSWTGKNLGRPTLQHRSNTKPKQLGNNQLNQTQARAILTADNLKTTQWIACRNLELASWEDTPESSLSHLLPD